MSAGKEIRIYGLAGDGWGESSNPPLLPLFLSSLLLIGIWARSWSTWFTYAAVIRNRNFKRRSLVLELIFFNAVRIKYENDSAFWAQTSKFKQYDNKSFNEQPSGALYWRYTLCLNTGAVYAPYISLDKGEGMLTCILIVVHEQRTESRCGMVSYFHFCTF